MNTGKQGPGSVVLKKTGDSRQLGSREPEKKLPWKSNSQWNLSILGGTPQFPPSLKFSRLPDYRRVQLKWKGWGGDEQSLDRESFDWGQGNSWERHRHIWPPDQGRVCL